MTKAKSSIPQDEHLDLTGSKKVTPAILVPGRVILQNTTTPQLVGAGNICRIEVAVDTYITFGNVDMPAVTEATSPGLKLKAGIHLVMALDDFIRSSTEVVRLEVIAD